ncbi:MAG: hypothetical protein NPIRA04_17650 [Nitrospirales bacterium]|nr:MAG: hypothetical protein NPIRA04_17650 [Nitrospirales bacterium]
MLGQRPEVLIARSVGIVCIALGFVLGMHGLDYPDSMWLPTALGLIVTGMVAQLFALIRSFMRAPENKKDPKL